MKDRKQLTMARSTLNGIIFYSNQCPYIASKTFVDNYGNIKTVILPSFIELFEFDIGMTDDKPKKN